MTVIAIFLIILWGIALVQIISEVDWAIQQRRRLNN